VLFGVARCFTISLVCVQWDVWEWSYADSVLDARKWFTGPKITLAGEAVTEGLEGAVREDGEYAEAVPVTDKSLEGDGIVNMGPTTKT
jgi:hypothetical protein